MVDTGSYELWVNPKCTTSPDPRLCGQFGRYNPQLSSTVHNMTGNFRALYGSGAAVGVYYADFVKVAGESCPLNASHVGRCPSTSHFGSHGGR